MLEKSKNIKEFKHQKSDCLAKSPGKQSENDFEISIKNRKCSILEFVM